MFLRRGSSLEWHTQNEVLRVEPWGEHAVRVRAAPDALVQDLDWALDSPPEAQPVRITVHDDGTARLVNGRITVEADADGRLRFLRRADPAGTAADAHTAVGTPARELLAEKRPYTASPGPRVHSPRGAGTYQVEQAFEAYDGERIFGLGQHLHGKLDQKGCVIDLVQGNTVATIPFLYSSRGYGLLWNNPAMGRVELGADATRWVADQSRQIDYWITAGDTPAQVMAAYADATGHPPLLPEWASGFWQSKLRYRTQEELLEVARAYRRRELPLSAMLCDFFHWPKMGDWDFERAEWPEPSAMVKELDTLGVKLAVSVWPTVASDSSGFEPLRAIDGLVRDSDGGLLRHPWPARGDDDPYAPMAYLDPTNPEARRLQWERLRTSYHEIGVAAYWLDACEPDLPPDLARRAVYQAGPGPEVGNAYGLSTARTVADGLRAAGNDRPFSLVRSAWAGSQRYGAALWSGDIDPTFASLATQIRAGLNVALSGIPWWNTDIGGFMGGDPQDPAYQEVLVRWFQYGTFQPIMRLHGDREPHQPFTTRMTGGPNEVWSYGEQAYAILREHLLLRERLRPYIHRLAQAAHTTGEPPMRPLFFEFPADEAAWDVEDQFLLGPDLLVAPVAEAGVRSRPVYLPRGAHWIDAASGRTHGGGRTVELPAPLERIPVLVRADTALTDTRIY
ncbi:TIM-barrel domain-containing protein [Streptomyces sp. NPDC053474]|uniref:glycoside hydrolase family 31 protein n=1 Tax=Streptomyces sp. NPDC053474 TaxID=3365704 RepID=UPI0037CFDC6C